MPGSRFCVHEGPREETVSEFPFVLLVVLYVITSLGQRPGITKRQDYIKVLCMASPGAWVAGINSRRHDVLEKTSSLKEDLYGS